MDRTFNDIKERFEGHEKNAAEVRQEKAQPFTRNNNFKGLGAGLVNPTLVVPGHDLGTIRAKANDFDSMIDYFRSEEHKLSKITYSVREDFVFSFFDFHELS